MSGTPPSATEMPRNAARRAVMRSLLMLLPLLLIAGTALSEQVSLRPPATAVELRAYGFGLFPFDGNFHPIARLDALQSVRS